MGSRWQNTAGVEAAESLTIWGMGSMLCDAGGVEAAKTWVDDDEVTSGEGGVTAACALSAGRDGFVCLGCSAMFYLVQYI